MNRVLAIAERTKNLAPLQGGVFSSGDLANLIQGRRPLANQRIISKLVREGVLFKAQRGFYTTRNPDLWVLGCRLQKQAYVSMDSVLAKNLLVGTIPQKSVSFVYPGKGRRVIETPFGTLRFFSSQKSLLFGFDQRPNGCLVATSEKAYLDILYYYAKGARFVIDPTQEVRVEKLNRSQLKSYLKRYRNPRFVAFVKGRLNAID